MEATMGIAEVADRIDTPDGQGECVSQPQSPPVACTLDAPELPGRLQEWRDVMAHVVGRALIDGGIRLEVDALFGDASQRRGKSGLLFSTGSPPG